MMHPIFLNTFALNQQRRNIPPVAVSNNKGYVTNSQVNVAPAVEHSSINALKKALGVAGMAHRDRKDLEMMLTAMFAFSDLPAGYEEGEFYNVEAGVFVRIQNYTVFVFPARMYHGGTSPRAPEGVRVEKWAYRMTAIWYPSAAVLLRRGAFLLSSRGNTILESPPDPLPNPKPTKTLPRCSFAAYGHHIMQPNDLRMFFAKEILRVVLSAASELHPDASVLVDEDKLLESMFWYDDQGMKQSASNSPFNIMTDNNGWFSKCAEKMISSLNARMTRFTPDCFDKSRKCYCLLLLFYM